MTVGQRVDILAFGAHPDDVEIGAGGILAKHQTQGFSVAICDLTAAELSSNGTVELRRQEAEKAAAVLGLTERVNLGFPDRGLKGTDEQIRRMIEVIRRLRPRIVLAPYSEDRHPDHVACSRMVKEAVFDAGIRNRKVDGDWPAHRVEQVFHYFINDVGPADVIVDITDVYERKMEAILAYASQFDRSRGEVDTPLNHPSYLAMIRGRDQLWGHQIRTLYGEGLAKTRPLAMDRLL